MFNEDGHSGLVRLTDSLKAILSLCARSTWEHLQVVAPFLSAIKESQRLAERASAGELEQHEANARIRKVLSVIPVEASNLSARYLNEIPSLSLSAILLSSFCLESYINSFANFLSHVPEFLSSVIGDK